MPEENKLSFSFDNLSDVHTDIQDESPEPSLEAIAARAATEAPPESTAPSSSADVDVDGTRFDANIHAVNREGKPSITSRGAFRRKKGASKVQTQSPLIAEQAKKDSARAAGKLAADMFISSAMMIGGAEWTPLGGDGKPMTVEFNEHENMRRAFADYFEAKNISDFPPGIALSIAISSYAMPRVIAGPETKTRMSKARIWFTGIVNKLKRKKSNAAQPDNGNDGKRENNAGETIVQSEQATATRHART